MESNKDNVLAQLRPFPILDQLIEGVPLAYSLSTGGTPVAKLTINSGGFPGRSNSAYIEFYDRENVLRRRDDTLKKCHEEQPKTGFLTEESEQDRLIYHRQKMESEMFDRQKEDVMSCFASGVYVKTRDPFNFIPTDCTDNFGNFKMGTIRSLIRSVRGLLANSKYTNLLLQDHNSFDRVEWCVFDRENSKIRTQKRPKEGDCLVLRDRKTQVIYVVESFFDNYTVFLLYLKFYGQYTRHPVSFEVEPSFFGGFDFRMLFSLLFNYPQYF